MEALNQKEKEIDSELASFRQRSRDHRNTRGIELGVVMNRVQSMSGRSSFGRSSMGECVGGPAWESASESSRSSSEGLVDISSLIIYITDH